MQIIPQPSQLNLDLFDPKRWPRRPYCTDNLEAGLRIRPLARAITKPYIQANPPHLRVWSIHDVDRPGGALAWEDATLPPPTWAAVNRQTGHAHLVWGLSAPVLVEGLGARDAPMRYLVAVEACFRERLAADPGFAGLLTKNPAHPRWHVLRGPRLAYALGELAEWLPELERHTPKPGRKVAEIGLGRNCTLFDWLRHQAYRQIRHYQGQGLKAWNAWLCWCNCRALERNADFKVPLDPREVWHVAKSVAKWTWRRFDIAASDRRFSKIQRNRRLSDGRKALVQLVQPVDTA